jgi:hypothetical protein
MRPEVNAQDRAKFDMPLLPPAARRIAANIAKLLELDRFQRAPGGGSTRVAFFFYQY